MTAVRGYWEDWSRDFRDERCMWGEMDFDVSELERDEDLKQQVEEREKVAKEMEMLAANEYIWGLKSMLYFSNERTNRGFRDWLTPSYLESLPLDAAEFGLALWLLDRGETSTDVTSEALRLLEDRNRGVENIVAEIVIQKFTQKAKASGEWDEWEDGSEILRFCGDENEVELDFYIRDLARVGSWADFAQN
eukprot:jgi/Mesvir1/12710/Mv04546-RA.1